MSKHTSRQFIPQIIPFLDESDVNAVIRTIQDNWITEGKQSAAFVNELKALIGAPYAVLAPNGTLALSLGLMALGIGPGDEVLVPDVTFAGSATAVIMVGATPVFVDVEDETFQLDMNIAQKSLTSKTKAIMPVHLYGTACDMDAIRRFSTMHQVYIIEDAAQGIGVHYKNQHVGSFGDIGCFSFFADKTITTGEGGLVTCKDENTYHKLCLLRNQGRIDRGSFIHPSIGFNFRMTDMQAAIGLNQLRKLEVILSKKRSIYKAYTGGLTKVQEVRILGAAKHSGHVPFRCVILVERAVELQAVLKKKGIQTRSFFYPLHKQPCFEKIKHQSYHVQADEDDAFVNANYGYEHGICLPIYPGLQLDQVTYIIENIRKFYQTC